MFIKILLIVIICMNLSHAKDDMLDDADESLDMDDINLTDGCNPSPYVSGCGSGRPIQRREKLEERNKIMIEKKIEEIRVKQEEALKKKIHSLKHPKIKREANGTITGN